MILVSGILATNIWGSSTWLRGLTLHLLQPLIITNNSTTKKIYTAAVSITRTAKLSEENAQLRNTVDTLTAEIQKLKSLEIQNTELRTITEQRAGSKIKTISGEIYIQDLSPEKSSLHINRGTRDGITIGDPVTSSGNILLGFVHKAYQQSAQVRLITHKDTRIITHLPDSQEVFVHNDKRLGLIGQDIGQDIQINQSSPIFYRTQLDDGGIYDIITGHVREVRLSEDQLTQEIFIDPATNIENVRFVSVITNAAGKNE